MLNPDGGQYDLSGDPYRDWRKNRQPNAGSANVGTDLNRNYDYRWGCCGGSSGKTGQGDVPRAAPVLGARVPGPRRLRSEPGRRRPAADQDPVSLHANGELVLYPYAYTTANVPADMTKIDHDTFVALAQAMAATNGYTPRQSGDWYISDGDEEDWLYGTQRIFSFTVEVYPPEGSTGLGGHHPPDEVIARETARNREALLYLIDLAGCPYRASGTQVANCGPLYDDLELSRGWTRDPFGEDTASTSASGALARGDPSPTTAHGPKQLGTARRARRRTSPAWRRARPPSRTTSMDRRPWPRGRSPCRPTPRRTAH